MIISNVKHSKRPERSTLFIQQYNPNQYSKTPSSLISVEAIAGSPLSHDFTEFERIRALRSMNKEAFNNILKSLNNIQEVNEDEKTQEDLLWGVMMVSFYNSGAQGPIASS